MSLPRYELECWWTREWQKILPEEGVYRFYQCAIKLKPPFSRGG